MDHTDPALQMLYERSRRSAVDTASNAETLMVLWQQGFESGFMCLIASGVLSGLCGFGYVLEQGAFAPFVSQIIGACLLCAGCSICLQDLDSKGDLGTGLMLAGAVVSSGEGYLLARDYGWTSYHTFLFVGNLCFTLTHLILYLGREVLVTYRVIELRVGLLEVASGFAVLVACGFHPLGFGFSLRLFSGLAMIAAGICWSRDKLILMWQARGRPDQPGIII